MLTGKGWFIWQVSRCERGEPEAIANKAAAAGLSHVLLKVAERTYAFGIDRKGSDLVEPVARALRARGIQVWGWHYVYGDKPGEEAQRAVQRVQQLQLDGYVIDAEGEYKLPGKAAAARQFMSQLRLGLPHDTPVALSSYRYPALHRQLPWQAFLESCDLVMPQVYWVESHNAATQLARSLAEFAREDLVGVVRPVVPTGAAFGAGNWLASAKDIQDFLAEAQRQKVPAVNFYSWDYAAVPDHRDLWDTVAGSDWGSVTADLTAEALVRRFFTALNSRDLPELGRLYAANAAHVTSERTRFSPGEIVAWYQHLLDEVLPGGVFTLNALTGSGSSRQASWSATSQHGDVADGQDSFGILDGHIQYQYTHFAVVEAGLVVDSV